MTSESLSRTSESQERLRRMNLRNRSFRPIRWSRFA